MTKRNITPFQSSYIERGNLKKELLFQAGLFSISYLYLAPDTVIKKHTHIFCKELYLLEVDGKDICLLGSEHDLENTSNETLQVIYIRYESETTKKPTTFKRNMKQLYSKLIEKGSIKKETILQDVLFSVYILYLTPGTNLTKHKHFLFKEIYLFKVDKAIICRNSENYDLRNTSGNNIKVICIRY